jgi:hypothetical protein
MRRAPLAALLLLLPAPAHAADVAPPRDPRSALKPFNDLVGSWRVTGEKSGRPKDFWQESASWQWGFHGDDAWLEATFEKGRYFASATLRCLPAAGRFALAVKTTDGRTLTFEGDFADGRLTAVRHDAEAKEDQRLVLRLLHFNRHLLRYETRPAGRASFTAVWQAGSTKEGVPFASVDEGPECVVSGGLGTIPVSYKGQTYYVCCTGCRDAFQAEPEKYIREYEARKKQKQ